MMGMFPRTVCAMLISRPLPASIFRRFKVNDLALMSIPTLYFTTSPALGQVGNIKPEHPFSLPFLLSPRRQQQQQQQQQKFYYGTPI